MGVCPVGGGMTLKQYAKYRFLSLCSQYREAKQHLDSVEGQREFILLSLQIHAAKGEVPKRMWPLANRS